MTYYIHGNCINCGRCRRACPRGAIHTDGLSSVIDKELCIGCGSCAEACRMGIILPEDYKKEIVPHAPLEQSCDVLVVGGGVAGLIAAAKCAEAGKEVILLEKLPKTGGGSQYAFGLRLFGTDMERRAGVPDQTDDYIRSALNTCRWEIDPRMIGRVFEALGECFDWMESWAPVAENWEVCMSPWGVVAAEKKTPGEAGWFITQYAERYCRKLGVKILTEHSAKELLVQEGRIAGAVADDGAGDVVIRAGATLLASGNISHGEVLRRTLPKLYYADASPACHRLPSNTGDHIKMAEDAGIEVDYDSIAAAYLGGMLAPGVPMDYLAQSVGRGESLKVNKNGRRWINESVHAESAIWAQLKQPDCVSFTVLDKKIMESENLPEYAPAVNRTGRNIAEGIPDENGNFRVKPHPHMSYPKLSTSKSMEEAFEDVMKLKGAHAFMADSLEELAGQMGVPAQVLLETVERYNELCAKGHDDDFYKLPMYLKPIETAPFFAIRTNMATDGVFGGLDADERMHVLSCGKAVPGLFCAGDTIGNRYINPGGEKIESINDFTWAFASGYLAGTCMLEECE